MIEIYLLKQLIELADCGTLNEAAKRIYLTQPTLTRSMQSSSSRNEGALKMYQRIM